MAQWIGIVENRIHFIVDTILFLFMLHNIIMLNLNLDNHEYWPRGIYIQNYEIIFGLQWKAVGG